MFSSIHSSLIVFSHVLEIKYWVKYLILDKTSHLEIAWVPSCLDKHCAALIRMLVVIWQDHCHSLLLWAPLMLPGKRDSGILAVVLCQAQNFLLSLQAGYTEILRALFDILTVDLVITEKYTKLSMFYLVLFFFLVSCILGRRYVFYISQNLMQNNSHLLVWIKCIFEFDHHHNSKVEQGLTGPFYRWAS